MVTNGFERVAGMADLREGEMLPVTANGIEVVLAKVRGNVFAFQATCSHQDAWLDGGWVHPETMEIECPLHEGRFDVRTGVPTQLPPTEPLKMFAVRVEGDDIFVSTSE
jgi:nitrite reductase/ring-hydroxylating ferredoxin subunit